MFLYHQSVNYLYVILFSNKGKLFSLFLNQLYNVSQALLNGSSSGRIL